MKLRNILLSLAALLPATIANAQTCQRVGQSCNGFNVSCGGEWRIGQTPDMFVALGVRGNLANFMIGSGAPNAVDLGAIGAPGCSLYTTPFTTVSTPLIVDGFANLALPIPDDQSLVGARFTVQVVSTNSRANALGIVTSSALDITIGS